MSASAMLVPALTDSRAVEVAAVTCCAGSSRPWEHATSQPSVFAAEERLGAGQGARAKNYSTTCGLYGCGAGGVDAAETGGGGRTGIVCIVVGMRCRLWRVVSCWVRHSLRRRSWPALEEG